MAGVRNEKEQYAIELLKRYKWLAGRIKLLEKQPIGGGLPIVLDSGEDKQQGLHNKLQSLPASSYLSPREQQLKPAAEAYPPQEPVRAGIRRSEVRRGQADAEGKERKQSPSPDRETGKVMESGDGGTAEGPDGVIVRISELQELQWRKELLDRALELLSEIRPELVKLLRLRYIEGRLVDDVATELCISRKTFDRWRVRAIAEFAHLICS